MTLDEIIARLDVLRDRIGGDAPVVLRDDYGEHFEVRKVYSAVDRDICGDPETAFIWGTDDCMALDPPPPAATARPDGPNQ